MDHHTSWKFLFWSCLWFKNHHWLELSSICHADSLMFSGYYSTLKVKGLQTGRENALYIELRPSTRDEDIFHDVNARIYVHDYSAKFSDTDGLVAPPELRIPRGHRVTFSIRVRQYTLLDRPGYPCRRGDQTRGDCLFQCAKDVFSLDEQTCAKEISNASAIDDCTEEAYEASVRLHRHLLQPKESEAENDPDVGRVQSICQERCPVSCVRTEYDVRLLDSLWSSGLNGSSAVLLYVEPSMEMFEESYLYDGSDLSSDIGGIMGLYMGLSILQVYEWFIDKVVRTYRYMQRKKTRAKNTPA